MRENNIKELNEEELKKLSEIELKKYRWSKLKERLIEISKLTESSGRGYYIYQNWFEYVTFESGKPDLLGLLILADIVYWSRPADTQNQRDKEGKVILKAKFSGDMLQRGIGELAEKFGVSKRQVSDALSRLAKKQLIIKDRRTVNTQGGMRLSNVLFLAPNVKQLLSIQDDTVVQQQDKEGDSEEEEISQNTQEGSSLCNQKDKPPLCNETHKLPPQNAQAYVIKRGTYTESTTKKKNNNNNAHVFPMWKKIFDDNAVDEKALLDYQDELNKLYQAGVTKVQLEAAFERAWQYQPKGFSLGYIIKTLQVELDKENNRSTSRVEKNKRTGKRSSTSASLSTQQFKTDLTSWEGLFDETT